MTNRIRHGLAALFLAMAGLPAAASPALAAHEVKLRFDPPMSAPLRYRGVREITVIRDGRSTLRDRILSNEELMVVERNKDGFLLRWITTDARVETRPEMQPMMEQMLAVVVDKPLLIQADADGLPIAVLNLADMRKMMTASIAAAAGAIDTRFASRPAAERAAMRQFLDRYLATFAELDDTALTQMLLEMPTQLLGLGGSTTAPGRPVTFETRASLPMTGGEVAMIGRVELQSHVPGRSTTFVVSSASNPEDVRRAVAAFTDKLFAGAPEAQRAKIVEGVRQLQDLSLSDELVLTLDAVGVPRRASYRRRAGTPADGELETRVFERLP